MSILQIFNWLIAGLAGATALVLWVVMVIYAALGDEPSIQDDWRSLILSTAIFTAVAALGFLAVWGMQKNKRWRWLAQAGLFLGLGGVALLMQSLR